MASKAPERGDLVEIIWSDIYEDATGNPENAKLSRRTSYGLYWSAREDDSIPVIITTTTIDSDGPAQQGFCIYPVACVRKITVIKKARKGGKRAVGHDT